jgi:rubredoxin-NAD+ reductase
MEFRKFTCAICDHVYDERLGDPDSGIAPGTRWEEIPDDWMCPDCGATKSDFRVLACELS